MPFPKLSLPRGSPRAFLFLLVVGGLVLLAARASRRARQADESVTVVRPPSRGKATAPAGKPSPPAPQAGDANRHAVPATVAGGLAAFRDARYAAAEVAWQQALIAAQRRRAGNKEVGDIVFRMGVVAGKLGRPDEARFLAAQADDFWTQARMSLQDRKARSKELQAELGVSTGPAGAGR